MVKILTHPTHQQYDCDYEEIINSALDNNVLVELNISYVKRAIEKDFEKFKRLIEIVKSKNKKLIINSDAHFIHEIGDDSILENYRDKLGLTEDIIINNYPEELKKFLEIN